MAAGAGNPEFTEPVLFVRAAVTSAPGTDEPSMTPERSEIWNHRFAVIERLVAGFAAQGNWPAAQRAMRLSREAYEQRTAELLPVRADTATPERTYPHSAWFGPEPANENRNPAARRRR